MAKLKLKMELVAKGATKVFDKELGPGVLASQEIEYNIPDEEIKEGSHRTRLAMNIMEQEDDFLKRHIEIRTTEV